MNMDLPVPREVKRTLFLLWLGYGNVKVFFSSNHPHVHLPEEYRDMPDMWVSLSEAEVTVSLLRGHFFNSRDERVDFSVSWDAVHTLESEVLGEVHVWNTDYLAAISSELDKTPTNYPSGQLN